MKECHEPHFLPAHHPFNLSGGYVGLRDASAAARNWFNSGFFGLSDASAE
jgi:hypothetical protein